MSYASFDTLLGVYGHDALFPLAGDEQRDHGLDRSKIEGALAEASAEIDSYLAVRYTLPLSKEDRHLSRICMDIAIYNLSLGADVLSEDREKRYDKALCWLQRVAAGSAALVCEHKPHGASSLVSSGAFSGSVVAAGGVTGPPRLFTRQRMRGL